MLGIQTVLGIILAMTAWFWDIQPSFYQMLVLEITGGIAVFVALLWIRSLFSLTASYKTGLSSLSKLYINDRRKNLSEGFLALFILFSFAAGAYQTAIPIHFLMPLWIVLLAISLDCIFFLFSRNCRYLDPFQVVSMLANRSEKHITRLNPSEFCHTIDSLTEIGLKAIQSLSLTLGMAALKTIESVGLQYIGKTFEKGSKEETEKESLYFRLSYLLQNFELIHAKALAAQLESFSSQLIVSLGKLTISVAHFDPQLSQLPLHYLGRFIRSAELQGLEEIAVKSTIILQEIASQILEDKEFMHLKIIDLFSSLIGRLEEIAKHTFRKDKTTDLRLLMQPFRDLKEKFTSEKFASHPDIPVLVKELDRVLGEFQSLEVVLQTVPNIPGYIPK